MTSAPGHIELERSIDSVRIGASRRIPAEALRAYIRNLAGLETRPAV